MEDLRANAKGVEMGHETGGWMNEDQRGGGKIDAAIEKLETEGRIERLADEIEDDEYRRNLDPLARAQAAGLTATEAALGRSQHFVTFYSPGTFVAEETTRPAEAWDVDVAVSAAREIKERHGATPYGFVFTTRGRGPADLDSRETARSPLYYLGGKVETLAEIEGRADPADSILLSNMRANGWDRVVVNTNSYRWTQPLRDGDTVLEFTP